MMPCGTHVLVKVMEKFWDSNSFEPVTSYMGNDLGISRVVGLPTRCFLTLNITTNI
jgi:hypothetical protein